MKTLKDELKELVMPWDLIWLKGDREFLKRYLAAQDPEDVQDVIELTAWMLLDRRN